MSKEGNFPQPTPNHYALDVDKRRVMVVPPENSDSTIYLMNPVVVRSRIGMAQGELVRDASAFLNQFGIKFPYEVQETFPDQLDTVSKSFDRDHVSMTLPVDQRASLSQPLAHLYAPQAQKSLHLVSIPQIDSAQISRERITMDLFSNFPFYVYAVVLPFAEGMPDYLTEHGITIPVETVLPQLAEVQKNPSQNRVQANMDVVFDSFEQRIKEARHSILPYTLLK